MSKTEIARAFSACVAKLTVLESARFNVAPTALIAAVRVENGERVAFDAKWGLIPGWSEDERIGASCSNARSETVDVKPAFRSAFKTRRCLVPVSGFYEWDQLTPTANGEKKQPHYFSLPDDELMVFAGLWEVWRPAGREPITSCTIITTEPFPAVAPYHDRSPVILRPEQWDAWLEPEADPKSLLPLLRPYDGDVECWPVSKAVNSTGSRDKATGEWVRNDSPSFIEPIEL